jgi:hypothetical protein
MAAHGHMQPKPVAVVVDKVKLKQQRQAPLDKDFRAELQEAAAQTAIQLVVVVELAGPGEAGLHKNLVMAALAEVQLLRELGSSTAVVAAAAYTGQVQMQDLVEEALVAEVTVTALLHLTQEHKMVNLIQAVVAEQVEILAAWHRMVGEVEAES